MCEETMYQAGWLRVTLLLIGVPWCAAAAFGAPPPEKEPAWALPPLERTLSIRDGRTGAIRSFDELLRSLQPADVVLVGETHNDEATHRFELAVYEQLLQCRQERVVLALEMFERDVQEHLDAYLQGAIDERAFLERARPWGNYRTAYRPLVERAKRAGAPVLASNFPRPLLRRLRLSGSEPPQALDEIRQERPDEVPATVLPNTALYWRRVDNAVRGHLAMMRPGGAPEQRRYSTQSLWDNTMAETCLRARTAYPDHLVLHLNGAFHSAYWDGIVHQLRQRDATLRVQTVSVRPVPNPAAADWTGKPVADFVVFVESRAREPSDGFWSVTASRKLKYRLHVPPGPAERNWPLLIWLVDDGLTAQDGLDLWRARLGDETVIAVVAAPYRETQPDLSTGGRWYWPDNFTEDVAITVGGVEEIWGYLLRQFPIDPERVCVAGEGTGATVAAATAALADRVPQQAVSLQPRRYAKLRDFPLPLPELAGDDLPADRALVVLGRAPDQAWWESELEQYRALGMQARWEDWTGDPWKVELQKENLLRNALGLPARSGSPAAAKQYILLDGEGMRARYWARLRALRAAANSGAAVAVVAEPPADDAARPLSLAIEPSAFAAPGALPRCPGPFGGTTVLVLPAELAAPVAAQWRQLQANDPIAASSRFHRLRLAPAEPSGLVDVLTQLESEGRTNVLIVPAVFCAEAARMRELKRSVRALENELTIHWLPGLGGRDVVANAAAGRPADTE